MSKLYRVFNKIDTVEGFCEECGEQTILVAIVSEFYRCTNCGHDTKQHINGRIRYLQLDESDKKWIKDNIKHKFIPEKNDFFIFPATLHHYVNHFQSEGERVSVSGNLKINYD
jgi:ribosomal protein S27AE